MVGIAGAFAGGASSVGSGAAGSTSFLSGIGGMAGSSGGSSQGSGVFGSTLFGRLGNEVGDAIFGNGGMSNGDFQKNLDRELYRSKAFLSQMSGPQLQYYKEMGISPWEAIGSAAAGTAAAPSSSPMTAANTALVQSKMNNDTALQVAKMNNETQLKTTAMTTGNGQKPFMEMKGTEQQIAESVTRQQGIQATTLLTQAQERLTNTNRENVSVQTIVSLFKQMTDLLPNFKYNLGVIEESGKYGGQELAKAFNQYATSLADGSGEDPTKALEALLDNIPQERLQGQAMEFIGMTKQFLSAGKGVTDFLGGIGKAFITGKVASRM